VTPSFDFTAPDHFTVGTVGPPGQRVFYLQVGTGGQITTFKLEKQQLGALSEYLVGILADLPEPEVPPLPAPGLVEPAVAEWTIGGIGIAYDEPADRVLLIVHEVVVVDVEDDDDDDLDELDDDLDPFAEVAADASTARVRVTRPQVVSFIERAGELLASGRPLCPFCGLPDGPDGHMCPRAN